MRVPGPVSYFSEMKREATRHAEKLKWFNVSDPAWGFEGKGWPESATFSRFDRLPSQARQQLPVLWDMSRASTGFSADFVTESSRIHARWTLRERQLDGPLMTRAAHSGLDLYGLDGSTWRWINSAWRFDSRKAHVILADELPCRRRRFRVYFPLRNPIRQLEIGVSSDAAFSPIPPRDAKPLVYYGSSIVHGAFASRPGMVFPSIVGRRLNLPVVNLGFSGQAKMHDSMARLLSNLDPSAYVIDAMPNMDAALVRERAEVFLTILCKARPHTPVVLVEDFPLAHAWCRPRILCRHAEKWRELKLVCRKLRSSYSNIHYIPGKNLIGSDNEATLDGIHPNDIGCLRLADNLAPALRTILKKSPGRLK